VCLSFELNRIAFVNPAAMIARSQSDTFVGIAPSGVAAFIAAGLIGKAMAVIVGHWLWFDPED